MKKRQPVFKKFEKRLESSYCPVSRQELFRLLKQDISFRAFKLFIFLRFLAVDYELSPRQGQLKITVREIKNLISWSLGYISKFLGELREKGLVKLRKSGWWEVSMDGLQREGFVQAYREQLLQKHKVVKAKNNSEQGRSDSNEQECSSIHEQTLEKNRETYKGNIEGEYVDPEDIPF